MLPPVLEIFVIWHPDDLAGQQVAQDIITHFRGQSFSGVIGGGVQVLIRSAAWSSENNAPRPCYTRSNPGPGGLQAAEFVAFVPVVGTEMAANVEDQSSYWFAYIEAIVSDQCSSPEHLAIFPLILDQEATNQTKLGHLIGKYQYIAASNPAKTPESIQSMRHRDLSQGLAQFMRAEGSASRVTIFISHTKRSTTYEGEDVDNLIKLVRDTIAKTKLAEYFDASDLQPGSDWDTELRENSSRSALLAIRTDLYSSREWCQKEISIAKQSGIPVVTLDAIGLGEERGSFLMDHVPRLPIRKVDDGWEKSSIVSVLNLLANECLKRAIWYHQQRLTEVDGKVEISWWAPHAPELLTLLSWMEGNFDAMTGKRKYDSIVILHPDPPLGPEERIALERQARLSFPAKKFDIMTPRTLAARGGT